MSDQPGSRNEPQEEIRALLTGIGAEEARLPADVAARLDQTLAGLVAERPERPTDTEAAAPETPPTRNRHLAPRLLAAAAAVAVVGGIGIGLARMADQGSTTAGSASGAASRSAPHRITADAAVPRLSTQHFRHDATRLLSDRRLFAGGLAQSVATDGTPASPRKAPARMAVPGARSLHSTPSHARPTACTGGSTASASSQVLPATVDGRAAAVVVRPLPGGRARVSAYACPGGALLASATVPR